MRKNMEMTDRLMRLLLALTLLLLYPFRSFSSRIGGSVVLARILLFTSLPGYCPLYERMQGTVRKGK